MHQCTESVAIGDRAGIPSAVRFCLFFFFLCFCCFAGVKTGVCWQRDPLEEGAALGKELACRACRKLDTKPKANIRRHRFALLSRSRWQRTGNGTVVRPRNGRAMAINLAATIVQYQSEGRMSRVSWRAGSLYLWPIRPAQRLVHPDVRTVMLMERLGVRHAEYLTRDAPSRSRSSGQS